VVTARCCRRCRLRFTADAAVYLTACPECGWPLTPVGAPEHLLGFRLFDPHDISDILPAASTVLPPEPSPRGRRS
jgi:hypothetical protein